MALNCWRSLDVLTPQDFKKTVHVVGVGAIGSNLVENLIRMGVEKIHVYDMDRVEDYNVPNQAFRPEHVGMPKVAAVAAVAKELGVTVVAHEGRVEKLDITEPAYLFACVDSMAARKSLFEGILFNPNVRWIEARMAAQYGIIWCVNPLRLDETEAWEKAWFPDDKAEASACTNRACATTARAMAAVMTHFLVDWEASDRKAETARPPKEVLFSLSPFFLNARTK